MRKKFFFSAAVFLAVLAFVGCDQEPFERREPLPWPPYDTKTGYNPFEDFPSISIKRAEVSADPSVIKVTFNRATIIADASKFTVKVNDRPAVRIGTFTGNTAPLLDKSMTSRTITRAAPATAGSDYDNVWNLTVSEPAKHGEILRLAITDPLAVGGVDSVMGNVPVPEFIVKNLVPRDGFAPTAAGFYEGSTNKTGSLASGTDETLYQRAITWLATPANQTNGAVYTIALGTKQSYTGAATFTAAQLAAIAAPAAGQTVYAGRSFTIVLTSIDNAEKVITVSSGSGANQGDNSALVVRNGVTLIIEKNVAIEHSNAGLTTGAASNSALITVKDGGKLILDGGEIRKNYKSGALSPRTYIGNGAGVELNADGNDISGTGGEAYFIMNSGKVTQNRIMPSEDNAAAGGVGMAYKSYFVMHGGEVSGNEAIMQTSDANAYGISGGIAGFFSVSLGGSTGTVQSRTNMQAFYMTGGAVKGNALSRTSGNTNPQISTGGIMLQGTFQKTGGTISDNTNDLTAGISRTNVAVHFGTSNTTTNQNTVHWWRDTAVGEDVILFTIGIKTGSPNNNAAGTVSKPVWAPDNWGK